jgi:hypothetical protein
MRKKRGLSVTPLRRDLPAHRASRRYFERMLEKWLRGWLRYLCRLGRRDGIIDAQRMLAGRRRCNAPKRC